MKMRISKLNKLSSLFFALALSVTSVFAYCIPAEALERSADSTVTVTYRAGEHGYFSPTGTASQDVVANAGSYLDFVAVEAALDGYGEAGYYIRAWKISGDGNEYKTTDTNVQVTKRVDIVPQYARLVNKATYQVNYVDRMGVQIAQPEVGVHEASVEKVLTAPSIPGYTNMGNEYIRITPQKGENTEYTFVYSSNTNEDTVRETVINDGTTVITGGGGTTGTTGTTGTGATGTTGTGAAGTTGTTGTGTTGTTGTGAAGAADTGSADGATTSDDGEVTLADQLTPRDDAVEIEDGEVGKSETVTDDKEEPVTPASNSWMIYLGAAAIILVAVGIIIYLKTKKPGANK